MQDLKIWISCILLVSFIISGCTSKHRAEVVYLGDKFFGYDESEFSKAAQTELDEGFITAKPGDTLKSIAQKHKVSPEDLAECNHLKIKARIKTGQKLIIPEQRHHVVQVGETLATIAQSYNLELAELKAVNHLRANHRTKLGDILVIPGFDKSLCVNTAHSTPSGYKSADAYTPITAKPLPPVAKPAKDLAEDNETDEMPVAELTQKKPIMDKTQALKPAKDAKLKIINNPSEFIWPVQGTIVSQFGSKPHGKKNDGINIACREGTPIKAVADGVVVYSGNELKGYGNLVIIRHSDGTLTAYAHQRDLIIKKGDKVKQYQVIGYVGTSGNIPTPQLHFAIRKNKMPVNPLDFLPPAD